MCDLAPPCRLFVQQVHMGLGQLPQAKGRHREGKFIFTTLWLESKKHCFCLHLWLSKKGCLDPRSFDRHSSQNSYFLPELIKGPFFQNMRASLCNFLITFLLVNSGTLWLLATPYLWGHRGMQALSETAFSFSLSLSPPGRRLSPDQKGWEAS